MSQQSGRFSKKIVSLVIIMNIIFTAAVLYIFWQVGNEPSTLIAAFFGFTTIELWALAGIRKKEIEKQNGNGGEGMR
mgnify:FL=1